MQNRYAGDIGDYGKLGLLRVLRSTGLTVGVNWYLTPDESHNGDGGFTQYLNRDAHSACDPSLWEELKHIVAAGQRSVYALQNDRILNAVYYSALLDYAGKTKTERMALRQEWHKAALDQLSGADIIFVDPDTGLIVPSAEGKKKENKYVLPDEIKDYYNHGSSVIYYQHKAHVPDAAYMAQEKQLLNHLCIDQSLSLALKFRTTSQRFYFILMRPEHKSVITGAVNEMIVGNWGHHFSIL